MRSAHPVAEASSLCYGWQGVMAMAEVLVFTGSLEGLKVSVRVPVICAHP